MWNSLPDYIKTCGTLHSFKAKMKLYNELVCMILCCPFFNYMYIYIYNYCLIFKCSLNFFLLICYDFVTTLYYYYIILLYIVRATL